MILSDQAIRRARILDPFVERSVHGVGASYGLSSCGYDIRIKQTLFLRPGSFRLASTVERFDMPDDVAAVVHDKSTLARLGIALQNTFIEPGWRGWLTLEITNHGGRYVRLEAGQPIAQVVFHRLDGRSAQPYAGKYQDQADRPVGAIAEIFADPELDDSVPTWRPTSLDT